MKSSLEPKEEAFTTTSQGKNKESQIKENNYLFNHIDKLAAGHDVTVSKTMIKITYKKALKDQNASEGTFDCSTNSDCAKKKKKTTETTTLSKSDISFLMKSPKVQMKNNKGPVFHSTPKELGPNTEKKKKYLNGLNLTTKPKNPLQKNNGVKVQKMPSSYENSTSNPKKPKAIPNKHTSRSNSDKKFLKGNGLVKLKTSIIQRNCADSKKLNLSKAIAKKIESGVKNRTNKMVKKIEGLKRKASDVELNVLSKCKKLKISENKMKAKQDIRSLEENSRIGDSKKPIMLVDPDLPSGWTRFIRTKNKGSANEQYVVYVVNPQGKQFRFKWKLRKYLQKTNSSLDADQFFFGLYQRPKSTNVSTKEKDEYSTDNATLVSEEKSPIASKSEPFLETENLFEENEIAKDVKSHETSNNDPRSSNGKELLLFDPDLPFGWKRIIHSNSTNGRKQVHIISPDGKIFRRRYRLNEYLIKHQFTHNLDRFYFGLYPKKEGNSSEHSSKETEEKTLNLVKTYKQEDFINIGKSAMMYNKTSMFVTNCDNKHGRNEFKNHSKTEINDPMYDDPNLPEGWKRFIKIRSCGESAGRMEVVIVSPDGRRHRSKKHLEHYLKQKQLHYKAEDFDFTVFGKSNSKKHPAPTSASKQEPELEPNDWSFSNMKKKFTDQPVPELDINSLKDTVITPEGHMINTVNGLMMCSGLSSVRKERRQKLPKREHEKQLKTHLVSEGDVSYSGCEIPTFWIQRLVKCRSDFKVLEPDAALTIAEAAKEFIKNLSLHALASSEQPESGLEYAHVAELVGSTECLSFLKTLIPKKITFKEYIKLNRPKQFMSFT